jgi:hypothetical protein
MVTIQISTELLNKLKSMRINKEDSYEEIIWDLVEDRMELSKETKRNIAIVKEDIKSGRTIKLEDLAKKLKINLNNK